MEKIDKKTLNKIRNYMLKKQEKGLLTGIDQIDGIMGGLKKGEMTVVGGWQAIGKTAFVLTIINKICLEDRKKCILISTRARKENVIRRLVYIQGKMEYGEADEEKIDSAIKKIEDSTLYIEDSPFLFCEDYIKKIRDHMEVIKDVDFIVIDDLQRVGYGAECCSVAEEEGYALYCFRNMAREMNCHVLVTCRLNKPGIDGVIKTERERTIPQLSDFEVMHEGLDHADNIMLLNRPYYFDLKEDKHIAHIYLEKGWVRCPGRMDLFYYPEYGLFSSERLEDVIEKNNN